MWIMFLQKAQSNSKVEQKWKGDFHDQVFFSHEKTNSCGVLTEYLGTEKLTFKNPTNRP